MRRWRVGNARKRAFHKFRRNREEPRREGCVETEDETEARVFQGHVRVGRTGTGMIHVAVKSWDSRNTSLARTRTFLSFCLRLFERPLCVLAGRHFRRDVILFEDGSALVLSSRNCNFYDRPYERLKNWSRHFGEHCFGERMSRPSTLTLRVARSVFSYETRSSFSLTISLLICDVCVWI